MFDIYDARLAEVTRELRAVRAYLARMGDAAPDSYRRREAALAAERVDLQTSLAECGE